MKVMLWRGVVFFRIDVVIFCICIEKLKEKKDIYIKK